MTLRPLCFVIMPFGEKPDPAGGPDIDFDKIYEEAIKPAIDAADMEPIRADEERTGGIIHKPMFERLLLCEYVLADLTTANANVFYELGVRHTARPATTLTIFAKHQPILFDVNLLRSMPYELGDKNSFGDAEAKRMRDAITARLIDLREIGVENAPTDSPLFQLLSEWKPGDIARLKTDVFADRVHANEVLKRRLSQIREKAKTKPGRSEANELLAVFRAEAANLDAVEVGTVVDLMLTYRALQDWDGMIALVDEMPSPLQRQILVREQLGFAYNRRAGVNNDEADRAMALEILTGVERQQGASSETCGLIGRIYKDKWSNELSNGKQLVARGHLTKAIDAYTRGFMADQRDAYPGINAITLLDIKGDEAALKQRTRLLPVVRFAVEQRLAGSEPDYWDHATMLELAVLDENEERAVEHLGDALAAVGEQWEPVTTANNLRMIARARAARSEDTSWLQEIIRELEAEH